jgi:hypothetical protein
MLTKAWKNYITVENIKRGFRATGIFPFINKKPTVIIL